MAKKKTRNALTYETLPALFTGICDAIRSKTGGTSLIAHQEIPGIISDLAVAPTIAFDINSTTATVTDEAYTYTVTKGGSLYGLMASVIYQREAKLYINDVEVTPTTTNTRNIASGSDARIKTYRGITVVANDVLKITWTTTNNAAKALGAYFYII